MLWPERACAAGNDALAQVQALDSAARVEEARLQKHCTQPGVPDPEGARIAEQIALIHITRIDIARAELQIKTDNLVPLVIQAVEAYRQSYRCDPRSRRALDEALAALRGLRRHVPPDRTETLSTLDARIKEGEAELAEHERKSPRTEPGRPRTSVGSVVYDGEVTPKGPLTNTSLGHLALRVEAGGGTAAFVDNDIARNHLTHRGWYLRLEALARYFPGGSTRIGVLFGPYFSRMSLDKFVTAQPDWPGNGGMTSFGAVAELQLVPFKRFPGFSINPFVTVGMGLVSVDVMNEPNFAGAYGGGGLHVCFLSGMLCPTLRLTSTPVHYRKAYPMIQGGLGVDLLRIADVVVAAVARKQKRNPKKTPATR
ncbi:hypothetical protein [Nannocystis pusilla]|uniref:Uncharacterized protein n=1 Tax=Nannocystis pusilla TaxID=889268 RepID=A0ABS7U356_9BACT|nr:hypothetical protein [Nannocystis pusilla]MBZ5714851.1 hypothetical protein [Nannocystis pusilla]